MDDVEIVIKIPETIYQTIKTDRCEKYQGYLYDAIRKGAPLPKSRWLSESNNSMIYLRLTVNSESIEDFGYFNNL